MIKLKIDIHIKVMKNIAIILTVLAALLMASCGGKKKDAVNIDSDTIAVNPADIINKL